MTDEQPILDCVESLATTTDPRLNKHIREDAQIALALAQELADDTKAALLVPGATMTLLRTLTLQERRLVLLEQENADLQAAIKRIENVLKAGGNNAGGVG